MIQFYNDIRVNGTLLHVKDNGVDRTINYMLGREFQASMTLQDSMIYVSIIHPLRTNLLTYIQKKELYTSAMQKIIEERQPDKEEQKALMQQYILNELNKNVGWANHTISFNEEKEELQYKVRGFLPVAYEGDIPRKPEAIATIKKYLAAIEVAAGGGYYLLSKQPFVNTLSRDLKQYADWIKRPDTFPTLLFSEPSDL